MPFSTKLCVGAVALAFGPLAAPSHAQEGDGIYSPSPPEEPDRDKDAADYVNHLLRDRGSTSVRTVTPEQLQGGVLLGRRGQVQAARRSTASTGSRSAADLSAGAREGDGSSTAPSTRASIAAAGQDPPSGRVTLVGGVALAAAAAGLALAAARRQQA